MPTAEPKPVRIRTDEYDRMADAAVFGTERPRMELVRGQLFEMPPIGTAHLVVVTRLQVMFNYFNAEGRLLVQQPLRVADFDEPQPDLTILCEPLFGLSGKPESKDCLLVIEVSDSTLLFDERVKVPAYLAGGVPAVWIVDIGGRDVRVYEAGSGGAIVGPRSRRRGEAPILMPAAHDDSPPSALDTYTLFANLPPAR